MCFEEKSEQIKNSNLPTRIAKSTYTTTRCLTIKL